MRISARNALQGKVKSIKDGAVMTEVIVTLTGGQDVVAIITKASSDSLGLSQGKDVYVVVKSTDVMIMSD